MEKTTLTSVGGITAAAIASLCCMGPVLVVLFGAGSIAAFSIFEIYRPYLIGLTVVLIGLAFYLTYRKREIKCEDGTCKVTSSGKWGKFGVWTAAVLAGVAISFPYFGFAPQASVNKAVDSTAVVTVIISGMDCKACAAALEASLAGMKGVRKSEIDFEAGTAMLTYDARIVKPTSFLDRINQNGFSATIEKRK